MKKLKTTLVVCLTILCLLGTNVALKAKTSQEENRLLIPVTVQWRDETDEKRPSSVILNLYRYTGVTFDPDTAILVESAEIKAENNWQYAFDITDQPLLDTDDLENGVPFQWTVRPTYVEGYSNTVPVQPTVTFIHPGMAGGWQKIAPCSSLTIPVQDDFQRIMLVKKGNNVVIWSETVLEKPYQHLIYQSIIGQVTGFGNPKEDTIQFINGYGHFDELNITVTQNEVQFGRSSNWSLLAIAQYKKGSSEATEAMVLYQYIPDIPDILDPPDMPDPFVPEQPEDPVQPEDPEVDIPPEDPDEPVQPDDPEPDVPEEPDEPVQPEDPEVDIPPEDPDEPVHPDDPEPDVPEEPDEPEQPDDPGINDPLDDPEPDVPEQPEDPVQPEDPEVDIPPEEPDEPEPSDPEATGDKTVIFLLMGGIVSLIVLLFLDIKRKKND